MTTPLGQPLGIRLVDRSRSEQGREHCMRSRLLGYHAGPSGYGWARKAQSVPAVTGQRVHDPIAIILAAAAARGGALPDDKLIYDAIHQSRIAYMRVVEERGLVLTMGEELQQRLNEQLTLLEGLVWAWARVFLPQFLAEWEIVEIEAEHVTVLGCTCGLGDTIGTAEDHDARECGGYGWMTRADCVARRRAFPHTHAYFEIKTTGDASLNWENQWRHRNQLKAGVMGAEAKLGVQIDEVYIVALVKGRRQGEWNPEEGKASGPKFQNSPLVYGWYRPANPPLVEESWAAAFYYFDGDGKRRKLTRDYSRTGIWTLDERYWKASGCQSPVDYWVRWLGVPKLAESFRLIGPIFRQQWQLDQFRQQFVGEERRIDRGLQAMYDCGQAGHVWGSPEMEAVLDRHFPMTRGSHCQNHFGDMCPMLQLCDREPGWQDPSTLGYIPRRPHHLPELEQAIARGLLPAAEGLEEDADE